MLKKLYLKNYRNLNLETNIAPVGNVLIAANGLGKSNLLEAIYFANLGRSFRPIQTFQELIGPGEPYTKIELVNEEHTLTVVVSHQEQLNRKFTLDGRPRQMGKVIGQFPLVLFAPHSVDLASNDPATRRQDLDDFLSFLDRNYASALNRYNKILKNRNALLRMIRDARSTREELQYWTEELVKAGTQLVQSRAQLFNLITQFVPEAACRLYSPGNVEFVIKYLPNSIIDIANYQMLVLNKYQDNLEKEIVVGQTLYGPHKDDYQLLLDGQNLRFLGSRAQQRLAILLWKLAQLNYLERRTGKKPLLLIDDLMSELDEAHRVKVAKYLLANDIQFILTSADAQGVPSTLKRKCERIELENRSTDQIDPGTA